MRRIVFLVSLSAVVVGALLFAYARGTQGEQARNDAGQPAVPSGSAVVQAQPNAPAPSAREPSASVKPEAWPNEPFFVHTTDDRGLVVYNMADGSLRNGYPPGLLSANGKRYVAFSGESLMQIDPASGRLLAHFEQNPDMITTSDWRLSSIDSGGRWAALTRIHSDAEKASWTKANTWQTDILVVDLEATHNAKRAQSIHLDGNFDVDAIAPNGGALFLIEHVPAVNPQHYLIRLYDLWQGHLQTGALRDKLAEDDLMTGLAWSSLGTPDGHYLLTLYLDTQRHVAFIHTLDLINQYPVCIDLPSGSGDMNLLKQYTLALAPDRSTLYAANAALGVVADVSLVSRSVHHVTTFTPNMFGVKPPDTLSAPTGRNVVSGDAARLFFTTGWDVWTFDARAGKVDGPILVNAPIADLAVSGDSRRLYVATAKDPALPLNDPVLVFDSASGEPLAFPRIGLSRIAE